MDSLRLHCSEQGGNSWFRDSGWFHCLESAIFLLFWVIPWRFSMNTDDSTLILADFKWFRVIPDDSIVWNRLFLYFSAWFRMIPYWFWMIPCWFWLIPNDSSSFGDFEWFQLILLSGISCFPLGSETRLISMLINAYFIMTLNMKVHHQFIGCADLLLYSQSLFRKEWAHSKASRVL
jgi:hypothetical protein